MSLYGMMRTGGSGMNAQSNRLSTVAENIANTSTAGYKRASTEFSSMILPSTGSSYNSGGVETSVRYSISEEGATRYTTSESDLKINGGGFFVVAGANNSNYLTRAGAFTEDKSGNLVNAAGYKLQGYAYEEGVDPVVVVNGFNGLTDINVASSGLVAKGSTTGALGVNLASSATITDKPYTTSLNVFDSQGNGRLLDFVYSKTGDSTWSLQVKDRQTSTVLDTQALVFDSTGSLATKPLIITTDPMNGLQTTGADLGALTIDLSATTQRGTEYVGDGGDIDGSAPSKVNGYEIDADGIVYITYENNTVEPRFRLALATVESPNNLVPQSSNVYSQGTESGVVVTGFAGSGEFGTVTSKALEDSNVDIAQELTSMIESQRSYTANSKVFQTGADLLDVLVNLKR